MSENFIRPEDTPLPPGAPPPGGWITIDHEPVGRLEAVRHLARDEGLRARVATALTIAGITTGDWVSLNAVLLGAPLLEGGPLVDRVGMTVTGNEWIRNYSWDRAAITDAMIEEALERAYDRREELGVALWGPEERGAHGER